MVTTITTEFEETFIIKDDSEEKIKIIFKLEEDNTATLTVFGNGEQATSGLFTKAEYNTLIQFCKQTKALWDAINPNN